MSEIRFSLDDIIIERLRRSGPGGQHRNKRETGIRLTHRPTGIVVMASERRSQQQNLLMAFERLQKALERKYAVKKPRKKTKPTRSSQNQRIQKKKVRSETKKFRRKPGSSDWSE